MGATRQLVDVVASFWIGQLARPPPSRRVISICPRPCPPPFPVTHAFWRSVVPPSGCSSFRRTACRFGRGLTSSDEYRRGFHFTYATGQSSTCESRNLGIGFAVHGLRINLSILLWILNLPAWWWIVYDLSSSFVFLNWHFVWTQMNRSERVIVHCASGCHCPYDDIQFVFVVMTTSHSV